LRWRIYKITPT